MSAASGGGSVPRAARARELWLAGLLALAASAAFAAKPVQQDDWAYLRVARHLLEDPGHVMEKSTLYQGQPIDVATGMLHGPVWLWILALAQLSVFGKAALIVAHLCAACMLALLSVSCASLGARLGGRPLVVALLAVLAPAPWVLGTTLMTDVPMLAWFCAALALAARGSSSGETWALILAGACGALAALTRYHGLAVLPLLALSACVWTRLRWKNLVPVLVASALIGTYMLYTRATTGRADYERSKQALLKIVDIDQRACLLAAVCALGSSVVVFVPALLAAVGGSLRGLRANRLLAPLALTGCAVGLFLCRQWALEGQIRPEGFNLLLEYTLFALGGAALLGALAPLLAWVLGWRRAGGLLAGLRLNGLGGEVLLVCWVVGFTLAAWLTVPFGCTRYALPAMLPVSLALGLFVSRHLPGYACWLAVGTTAGLGATCAVADLRAALVYPEIAAKAVQNQAPGGAWSTGKTWIWGDLGFRWYLEELAGDEVLASSSNAPLEGDRLLKSALCTSSPDDGRGGIYKLHPDLVRRLHPTQSEVFEDSWPARIHNPRAGAGFYNSQAGFLPFALSRAEHDELQVWTVLDPNPFFAGFARALKEPWKHKTVVSGNIRVERYSVGEDFDRLLAVAITFPGRVTWADMQVPERGVLGLYVGEHARLASFKEPGPGSIARVLVAGEVVAELNLDTRREPSDRGWHDWQIDLSRWVGQRVALGFESAAQPAPDGVPPEFASYTQLGFAEPRLYSAP